jgi:peptidoglycan/xylan/chitin deacetylase (PgdA/CDA1 family)
MSFLFLNKTMQGSPDSKLAPLSPPIRKVSSAVNPSLFGIKAANRICLTFDDGPDPAYTPKILAVLADYHAKATFFIVGEAALQFPCLVEKIINAGHAIGNHTYSHRHPWLMSAAHAQQEVLQASNVIKHITGTTPRWFRPPFGRLRTAMRLQAQAEQMRTVLWSRSIIDWGMLGTKTGISKRLNTIEAGDIVLLHDGRPKHNRPDMTYQCLPKFLRTLADKSLVAQNLDEVYSEKKANHRR